MRLPRLPQGRDAASTRAHRTDSAAERLAALRRAVLFCTWPEPVLARLAQASRMESVPANTAVMQMGQAIDAIRVLVSGSVQIGATTPRGRRVILKLDSPGEFYGLLVWAQSGVVRRHDAVTMTASRFLVIPADELGQVLTEQPQLWRSIAVEASRRVGIAIGMALGFGLESLQARFAKQILQNVESTEAPSSAGDNEIRMSQQTMAELLGVSRQTVTALAGEFRQRGLIQWRYGRILVLDLEGLRQAAGPVWSPTR